MGYLRLHWLKTLAVVMLAGLACGFGAIAGEPYGKIGEKYAALGGARGALGPAIGNEADAAHGGRFHYFRNGAIYWHPELGQAYAVWGAIAVKYYELGRTEYGYPITDEMTTPDGRGRYNHFRAMHVAGRPESSIYWTPETGAHAIYGLIRDAWAKGGWERGELGYPTSDEFQEGKYRRVNFERGHILWAPDTGIRVVKSGMPIILRTPPNTFGSILVTGMEVAAKGSRLAGDATFLSENTVCGRWSQQLGGTNAALKEKVRATVNPRMGGFTIRSDAQMSMTPNCSFRAEIATACADTMTLRMLLPGNLFKFHVTTPSILPGWTDPEFSIDFDLEATATIRLPKDPHSPIGLGAANLRVSRVRFDSQNASGDLALAAAKVHAHFGGQDFLAQLRQDRQFQLGAITETLASLNPALGRIPANYRIESCIAGDTLRLNGTDAVSREPVVN